MPKPLMKQRTFRIREDRWVIAKEISEANGEDLSAVVREAIDRYIKRGVRPLIH